VAAMDSELECTTQARRAGIARSVGAALALGLAFAASTAQAGVPLPVVAETAGEPSLAAVVKRIAPAVVNIEVKYHIVAAGAKPGRQASSGGGTATPAAAREMKMTGSGVVFDARRGLIITNSHVIDHAEQITVKLTDGGVLSAQRVGADPDTDVAVIKVAPLGLTELAFADSDRLEVGDFVFAVGHPLALGQTVTAGIVSGLHRSNVGLRPIEDFIQTDAGIYPGNSGGALVNLRGDLVGINTAFIGATRNNSGLGFAIPANLARTLAERMLESGDIRRGALGFAFDDPAMAVTDLKLSVPPPGAMILEVDRGSAAERAGLKAGDLVTELGGTPLRDAADLQVRIALLRAGEVAEFAVSRRGSFLTMRAPIASPKRAYAK
jgi:S1-C subfamily serine protease